jgi:hypothetical protein
MRAFSTGRHPSEETRAKLRFVNLGRHHSKETRIKLRVTHLGHAVSDETRAKIGVANQTRHISDETRAKIRAIRLGSHLSVRARAKLRIAVTGDKNVNWRGGIHTPYGPEFNRNLKAIVRQRDDYLCQNPECYLPENGRKHPVHHIDFNKGHNDPVNLIILCAKHHAKTTVGDRNYWMEYYQNLQEMRAIK